MLTNCQICGRQTRKDGQPCGKCLLLEKKIRALIQKAPIQVILSIYNKIKGELQDEIDTRRAEVEGPRTV